MRFHMRFIALFFDFWMMPVIARAQIAAGVFRPGYTYVHQEIPV